MRHFGLAQIVYVRVDGIRLKARNYPMLQIEIPDVQKQIGDSAGVSESGTS
jgi:hypothetical protein